jgi:hypothetical protein
VVSLQRRLCGRSAIRHFGVASLYIDRIACQASRNLLAAMANKPRKKNRNNINSRLCYSSASDTLARRFRVERKDRDEALEIYSAAAW